MVTKQPQSLKKLTTFQQEGSINSLSIFSNETSLRAFILSDTPYYLLGKGSNSIINPNSSVQQIIQISSDFYPITVVDNVLTVSAGITVNNLMKACIEHGLSGLEFVAGVPASVGGMVAMNFGCWGIEIANLIDSVRIMDEMGTIFSLPAEKLDYSYRHSIFQERPWIILSASFVLQKELSTNIKATTHRYIKDRLSKQPLRGKTFGSIFKNPPSHFAADLIEKAGLKGYEHEGIIISQQHANFMENVNSATYEGIQTMISYIQYQVSQQFNINLEPEVKIFK